MTASSFVEMPIPSGRGGHVFDFSGVVRPRHHHDELEFNLGVRGSGRFSVGNRRVDLVPGRLLWFLPGQDHVLEAATADFQMWIVPFKPYLVDAYVSRGRSGTLPSLSRQVRDLAAAQVESICALCEATLSGAYDAGRDAQLVALLDRALQSSTGPASPRARVEPSIEKILAKLAMDPSLGRDELARFVGLGPEALSRKFAGALGISLPEYKNRLRIGRFLRVMEGGESNLMRAALEAGFGSYPQFHRVIREQTGESPSAFASADVRRAMFYRSIPRVSLDTVLPRVGGEPRGR